MWPQYTVLFFAAFSIGAAVAKKDPEDFFITIIAQGFFQWLLYMGGFYHSLF